MEETSSTVLLSSGVKNLTYIAAAFLGLNPLSYYILGIFMILDTFTGVVRSGVIHGWRSVTSHAASIGVLSKCTVILVPLLLALAGKGIGFDLSFIAKSALNILILAELYSILSNIQSIRVKQDVEEFDAVNYVLGWIRTLLEKKVKRDN